MRAFGFTCRAYSGEGRWIPRTRLRASATATLRVEGSVGRVSEPAARRDRLAAACHKESHLVREHDCSDAVAEVEFLEYVRDVCLDGRGRPLRRPLRLRRAAGRPGRHPRRPDLRGMAEEGLLMSTRLFADENRKWWTLAAVSFGLFMIMLDNTVVNVALPQIQRSLDLGNSTLEWVVVGYALTFATFMLTGGKLADLFGRRLLFMIGLAIFTASSLACGLATSAAFLIAARVVQGVGAALMNPATLGIITATFPPRQRGTAIGIWAGTSAMALAIGPLVGGLLTEKISWSWIFYVNVPVGLLGIFVARWAIDETRDTSHEQRLDLPGLVSSAVGLFALTYGLIESNRHGWTSALTLSMFGVALAALAIFVLLEQWQRIPMLDLSLFRNPTFAGANLALSLVALSMFGVFFYNSLFI